MVQVCFNSGSNPLRRVIIATAISLVISFVGSSQTSIGKNYVAYAHNFEPNSLSTFLELAHRTDVELSLAKVNFPSNVTLALDHGEQAVELLNDVYRLDDDVVEDRDFIKKYNEALNNPNATVHALVVANLVDSVLKEYGKAFDLDYDLTNMSNMALMTPVSKSCPGFQSVSNIHDNSSYTSDYKHNTIINLAHFQSAQQLSKKTYQIFINQLRHLSPPSNSINADTALPKLEQSLLCLESLVNKRVDAKDLMMLVHGQLHPSLQLAFNLKLRR